MGKRHFSDSRCCKKLEKDVYKMKRYFKKPEVKSLVINENITVSNGGNLFQIASIPQGITNTERIGNSVDLLSSNFRFMWALADTGYNNCRIALVKTRKPVSNLSSIFEATSFAAFGGIYAAWDYDTVQKVYLDNNTALNQQVSGLRVHSFKKKYVKHPETLKFSDTTATSQLDNIYIVVVTDSAVLPHPRLNLIVRTRYTDV